MEWTAADTGLADLEFSFLWEHDGGHLEKKWTIKHKANKQVFWDFETTLTMIIYYLKYFQEWISQNINPCYLL